MSRFAIRIVADVVVEAPNEEAARAIAETTIAVGHAWEAETESAEIVGADISDITEIDEA